MSLIALFSDKGSPGATTLALALATVWPQPVALVECDPAGGDLALRLTDPAGRPALCPEPGLLTLAADARRDPTGTASTWAHGQPLLAVSGPVVVPGLDRPEQGAALAGLWPSIAALLARPHGDVLADLGRLHPGSPASAVAEVADVLVGVARGSADGMLRMRDRFDAVLTGLPARPDRRTFVVLVVEDRRAGEAVAAMRAVLEHSGLPVTVAGFLAHDPATVRDLLGGQGGARLQRSLLARSACAMLPLLTDHTEDVPAMPQQSLRRRGLVTLGRPR